MRVVIAPDSFGGTLSPVAAADAMAAGWRDARPGDDVVIVPMSDGGEGLLDAVAAGLEAAGSTFTWRRSEVVGPRGLAVTAPWLLLEDGEVAIIESARACGLALLAVDERDPLQATTWGVGQLVAAAAATGARRIVVGLGGSATVDGGAGALSGLGWQVTVADGQGLKIGGGEVGRAVALAPTWVPEALAEVTIEVLADVQTPLPEAAARFGPQKGADEPAVAILARALDGWADVLENSFERPGLRHEAGTGAAGGLGMALVAAHDAVLLPGGPAVAELVGLERHVQGADVVVTGEGRFDDTSLDGKVVGQVLAAALAARCRVVGVCGEVTDAQVAESAGFAVMVAASPEGAGPDPALRVREATARAARDVH